jgi:hypothetical protein
MPVAMIPTLLSNLFRRRQSIRPERQEAADMGTAFGLEEALTLAPTPEGRHVPSAPTVMRRAWPFRIDESPLPDR